MTSHSVRILLVEDQAMVLGALATLLSLEPKIEKVITATNAGDALKHLELEKIDILISDIEMPGKSGLELCQEAALRFPNVKRILITTFRRAGYIKRALDSKISGFLLKDSPPEKLVKCIFDVYQGKRVIDPELLIESLDVEVLLNTKERKALLLVQQGKSNQEIADELNLSLGTIKNYISSCIAKVGANNRTEAVRIALKKGLL